MCVRCPIEMLRNGQCWGQELNWGVVEYAYESTKTCSYEWSRILANSCKSWQFVTNPTVLKQWEFLTFIPPFCMLCLAIYYIDQSWSRENNFCGNLPTKPPVHPAPLSRCLVLISKWLAWWQKMETVFPWKAETSMRVPPTFRNDK